MTEGTKLVKYDAMVSAIEAAYRVDEVKDIRDKAMAIQVYARQANNVEAERQACEIRLRAERKAGQLLKATAKRGERDLGGRGRIGFRAGTQLKDMGVTKKQSAQWQKLADVPERQFENGLQAARPTTASIIAAPRKPVGEDALWLWGRLNDFEDRFAAKTIDAVMESMTDVMRRDVERLAPIVSTWLQTRR